MHTETGSDSDLNQKHGSAALEERPGHETSGTEKCCSRGNDIVDMRGQHPTRLPPYSLPCD